MKRLLLALAVGLVALAVAPAASAHPLGNFSVNHLAKVSVSDHRIDVRYVLDQAEIPTFQERALEPGEVIARKRDEIARGLSLTVDGRRVPLRIDPRPELTSPPGQGGLPTTRIEFAVSASVSDPGSVELRDESFSDRVGWRAIVSAPGEGTAVRTGAPSGDPTNELRSYPDELLESPLDQRSASFSVKPGPGTLTAPRGEGGKPVETARGGGDGLAGVFEDAASGEGVLLFLLLAALGWGALHALSPGHGKAMVAAYLVGQRGTPRHAVALGAVVTLTHTIGVFALGLVTLLLSQYVLPEQLYPWLTLASGLLVVVIGAGVLRSRIRWAHARRAERDVAHAHGRDHARGHSHHHHAPSTHHHPPGGITWKGLLGMGASAGLIPCPSALVVLLAAVSQHQVALGMVLIVAFSVGLAATLTALGLAVVYAGRLTTRIRFTSRFAAALPALSAVVIVGAGFLLTANAIPELI